MAMQQTNSSFSKRLGARVAAANAEHKDKPIDTGMRRLPGGIKSGIAKLQFMYTKESEKDDGKVPKGETFLRASASVLGQVVNGVLVKDHLGENIEGLTTQRVIPLCDVPANPKYENSKAVTFSENWYEFQNLFKLLSNGSIVCQETPQTDPTGQKTEAFYFSAMNALTNPKHPIYLEFSTREWKAPKRANESQEDYNKREAMVFETWHGLAQLPGNGQHDPAAGVTTSNTQQTQTNTTHPMDPPPAPFVNMGPSGQATHPQTQTSPARVAAPPPVDGPPPQHQSDGDSDYDEEAEVEGLVEVAMFDPNSETPDGKAATTALEEMAWKRGWTKEQTRDAEDWAAVGNMALTDPPAPETPPAAHASNGYTVGSRWMYVKRMKDGKKYADKNGKEFAAQECEITTVNEADKTCTLKTVSTGLDLVDLRSKKPVAVKFEWLEPAKPF